MTKLVFLLTFRKCKRQEGKEEEKKKKKKRLESEDLGSNNDYMQSFSFMTVDKRLIFKLHQLKE